MENANLCGGGKSRKLQTHRAADLLDGVDELLLRGEGVVVGLALVEVAIVLQHRHLAALGRAEATEARIGIRLTQRIRVGPCCWNTATKGYSWPNFWAIFNGVAVSLEGIEAGVDAAEKRATAGVVDAPDMGAIEAALRRAGAWG